LKEQRSVRSDRRSRKNSLDRKRCHSRDWDPHAGAE
jgi:hypothetical protein